MTYRQEHYRAEAEDNGEVLRVGRQVEVATGHNTGTLLTKDTSALDPKVLQIKVCAPGVGRVLTLGLSGGGGREGLVNLERVDAATARAAGTARLGAPYP